MVGDLNCKAWYGISGLTEWCLTTFINGLISAPISGSFASSFPLQNTVGHIWLLKLAHRNRMTHIE